MAESFKEDRLNLVTFDGVQKKDELIKAHSIIHTKHAAINGSLRLLNDNPKAFIISFDSKEEKKFSNNFLIAKIFWKTFFSPWY